MEKAVSSPNTRGLGTITICSAQQCGTKSTINVDGVLWKKADGSFQRRTASSLMQVRVASKVSYAICIGTKSCHKEGACGAKTVMTGHVR